MNPRDYSRVFLAGNGGSAANATHIANDFIAAGIRAHSLTADVATLTAIANDYGYEHVFSRQLKVLADPGDLLIVLSGSGNSPNILQAVRAANAMGVKTFGLLGVINDKIGWVSDSLSDGYFITGHGMQRAEEGQLTWGHQWIKKN